MPNEKHPAGTLVASPAVQDADRKSGYQEEQPEDRAEAQQEGPAQTPEESDVRHDPDGAPDPAKGRR